MNKFSLSVNSESPGESHVGVKYIVFSLVFCAGLLVLYLLMRAPSMPDISFQAEVSKKTTEAIPVETVTR